MIRGRSGSLQKEKDLRRGIIPSHWMLFDFGKDSVRPRKTKTSIINNKGLKERSNPTRRFKQQR